MIFLYSAPPPPTPLPATSPCGVFHHYHTAKTSIHKYPLPLPPVLGFISFSLLQILFCAFYFDKSALLIKRFTSKITKTSSLFTLFFSQFWDHS